ncbi:MAG: hypothetical protein ACLQVN_18175 [Bryobacteraceae bacterium]
MLLAFGAALLAETFPAKLEKPLWPDRQGSIEINDKGITYTAPKPKRGPQWLGIQHVGHALDRLANRPYSLRWKWVDIQYFDRISPKEFVVLTYQDDWRFLGRDREYRFRLTAGELTDSLFQSISGHLKRPVTDRVPPGKVNALYTVPVKRDRTFGGSEGELEFTRDSIYYVTRNKTGGRTWRMDRDIVSVWSDDPYRLEIRAYENDRREFSRTAAYKFDLKQKLDPEFYRELKLKLFGLETNNEVIR